MVKKATYIPGRGDFVWVTMDPTIGHEQAGRRPALVLSPKTYNAATGMCLAMPMTSHIKKYPYEVGILSEDGMNGAVLVDQIRSLDWKERKVRFIRKAPDALVAVVKSKLKTLLW